MKYFIQNFYCHLLAKVPITKKSRQLKNLHERLLLGGENYMNFERTVNLNVTFYNKPSNISTIMHHRTSQAGLEASAGRENDRPRDHQEIGPLLILLSINCRQYLLSSICNDQFCVQYLREQFQINSTPTKNRNLDLYFIRNVIFFTYQQTFHEFSLVNIWIEDQPVFEAFNLLGAKRREILRARRIHF